MKRFLLFSLFAFAVLTGKAFPQADEQKAVVQQDSVRMLVDSLIRELQAVKIKELDMREKLKGNSLSAREDSLRKAQQKQRIDSLRSITPGVPLVVESDTLLYIYASLGGDDPVHRAATAERRILRIGKRFTMTTDSIHIFEGEYTADIMCCSV